MSIKTFLIIYICDLVYIPVCMMLFAKTSKRTWYYPYVFLINGILMLFIILQYSGVV